MTTRLLLSTILVLLAVGFVHAQQAGLNVPTLSPISEVSQEVGLTTFKLSYSRPSAKGRKIFGELVPYGEIWRTGANASTKLTFAENVKIEGNPLKAGTYALYTIPGENEWTIIVHTNTSHRSLAGDVYKQAEDAFRFTVKPTKTPQFVETFTMQFGDITTNSTALKLAWENTGVKFRIETDVHAAVDKQIATLAAAAGRMAHRDLFRAAEYYYHNNRDLTKAEGWIKDALAKSPKSPMYGLLHARILSKAGKRDEALKVIAEANAWAKAANNANYTEQTQVFWDSIKN
ncbi:MAG TPA: DUF2911 domain-containing protein [Pyrinomonadaceae bacterium]